MTNEYNGNNIQVLEGLEAVRKRPSMYIGSTSSQGLHHLVYEVVDNCIDEALAGFCENIDVTIQTDGSISVKDDGRGIPIDKHSKYNKSALEVVMTILHAGGKFDNDTYKVSGGLHGVGVSVVNALSSNLCVEVCRNGKKYRQEYERGVPKTDLQEIGNVTETGTYIHFTPDNEIFETTDFDYDTLMNRLRELAFLNKGITINIKDERNVSSDDTEIKNDTFKYDGGIVEFIDYINTTKTSLHEQPIYIENEQDDISIEIALQYTDSYNTNLYSFANNINTHEGGTHVQGFRTALTRVANKFATEYGISKTKLSGEDVREGLTAIISVKIADPQFEGQTKTKLGNSEVVGLVSSLVSDGLSEYFIENPKVANTILEKAVQARTARTAAKKARDLSRRKSTLESSTLPGKLADCSNRNPSETELFLVEGDSAGGSAKQGRDRQFQAILPFRGKILNVEKSRLGKLFKNNEIVSLITALGTGIGDDFDITKARYHKIVIMTDADVDGAHIRTLILTLMFRYMRPLVEAGYVYVAQPPLYKIKKGKTETYAYSDAEKDKKLKEIGTDKVSIQRYKGLGEMDAGQLWETTMDPESRKIVRINIEDEIKSDQTFQTLMGSDVTPRREFIQKHAKDVINIDI